MFVDSVVVGNTVESMFYALKVDAYHLTTPRPPLLFYRQLDIPIFGSSTEPAAWSKLSMMLGLCGKLINFEEAQSVKVSDNTLKVNHSLGLFKLNFGKCEIFSSSGVLHENNTSEVREKTFLVLDDFELKNLGKSTTVIAPKIDKSDFTGQIHFYTSDRVDGAHYVTDCVAQSILTKEQLLDFSFSDTMARFSVERYLNSVDILGTPAGRYKSGKIKYRKPRVRHVRRIISEIDNSKYVDSETVFFVTKTLEEIINE